MKALKSKIAKLEALAMKMSLPRCYRIFERTDDARYKDLNSKETLSPDEYALIEHKVLVEYY